MATIKSGYSTDYLEVDANRGARVNIYDSGGNNRYPAYIGGYMAHIEAVPSSILSDGTTYWAMRNTGSRVVLLRVLNVMASFTGTTAATRSIFRIERFSAAMPSGGTALQVVKRDNSDPNSSIGSVAYANGGLTATGVIFEGNSPGLFGTVNVLNGMVTNTFDFTAGGEEGRFALAVGEGLCIRAHGPVVAGIAFHGSIWWDER